MTTTNALLYPSQSLTLGLEGRHPAQVNFEPDPCCSDPLCASSDESAMGCAFIDALPSGPMWDKPKIQLQDAIRDAGGIPAPADMPECVTMVNYALYVSRVLSDMVSTMLAPSIRDQNPNTAVNSLDDWLVRYGWYDCYSCNCDGTFASLFSPYRRDVEWSSAPCCCDPFLPEDFRCAMKHALVRSLRRMERGVVRNLDGINWIIEPLGAQVRPREPYPDHVQRFLDGTCETGEDEGSPCFCEDAALEIFPTLEDLPVCPTGEVLCSNEPPPTVPAQQLYYCEDEDILQCPDEGDACEDERTRIYPAVIAAECIVRSLLPAQCPNMLYRSDEVVDRREYP